VPRILVVAPNWIGDALMAQPLFGRLREKAPDLKLDVLAPEWVAPVVRRMPEVDDVIVVPFRHGALQLRERWKIGRELKGRAYDQAIVLPNTWKSALVPFFADIALRSGYAGELRYGLLNLLYKKNGGPMPEHYARLSEPPGKEPAAPLPAPRLRAVPHQIASTLARFGIEGPYAVFCPRGGVWAGKALALFRAALRAPFHRKNPAGIIERRGEREGYRRKEPGRQDHPG
jgi:heptosyltransferase-2